MEELKLKHSSVEWANETGNCEKEYTYPARRKDLEKAFKEALDECLKLHMETVKLRAALNEAKERIIDELQASYDSEHFNAKGDGSQPLIDLESAKCAVETHLT